MVLFDLFSFSAKSAIPCRRADHQMETENNSETAFRDSILGDILFLSLSHLETAALDT